MCFVTAEADLVSASPLRLHFKTPERFCVPPSSHTTLHTKRTRHEHLKVLTHSVQQMHVSQLMAQCAKKVAEDDVALLLLWRQPVMTSGSELWISPDAEI